MTIVDKSESSGLSPDNAPKTLILAPRPRRNRSSSLTLTGTATSVVSSQTTTSIQFNNDTFVNTTTINSPPSPRFSFLASINHVSRDTASPISSLLINEPNDEMALLEQVIQFVKDILVSFKERAYELSLTVRNCLLLFVEQILLLVSTVAPPETHNSCLSPTV